MSADATRHDHTPATSPLRGLMFGLLVSCPVWVVFAAGVVGAVIKH